MPEQLKELLEKIKNEGIQAVQDKAREIESAAKKRAEDIVNKAKKQAQQIVEEAKEVAAKTKKDSEVALQQAARNLMLAVKEQIHQLLAKIVSEDIGSALSGEQLGAILSTVIEKYAQKNAESCDIKVLLKQHDLEKLKDTFISRLQKKIKEGIELKPSPQIKAGFSISFDKGQSYYEFTEEALTECLGVYLNEELAKLLNKSVSKSKE